MVRKSLTFMALLLCAILAQSILAEPVPMFDDAESENDESNDAGEDEEAGENSEDEEETVNPSLSCLLFKDVGCNSECSVMGLAFGYPATGTCGKEDDVYDCSIEIQGNDSLDKLWKAKFDSKDILQQIKKDAILSEQVRDILQDPFQTAQEAKDQLRNVLCQGHLSKLQLNDDSDAAIMTKKGKSDLTSIKEYVAEKFPATLKPSDSAKLSASNYKSALYEALKSAKEQENNAFDELVSDVRRTRNKSLSDVLAQYLRKNKLKAPAENKNEPSVADIIADFVIDELVKKVSKKKPATNKKSPPKKPVKKPVQNTKSKKSKNDDEDDADTSDVVLKKDRFMLKNFDKSVIKRSGNVNQNLTKNGYTVRYQRNGGNVSLVWIKDVDELRLQKSSGGNVNQDWRFGNVTVQLSKDAAGNINHNWNFGNTTYQYSKSADGNENSNWSSGKPNKKILKTYQQFINAWCRDNDFLVERENCVIYNE